LEWFESSIKFKEPQILHHLEPLIPQFVLVDIKILPRAFVTTLPQKSTLLRYQILHNKVRGGNTILILGFFQALDRTVPVGETTGRYGKSFDPSQVTVVNDGLALTVQHTPGEANVKGAQLESRAQNILFGSFRAVMQLPPGYSGDGSTNAGTCAALFYFLDNLQEIDMEFLSQYTGDNRPNSFYGTQTGDPNQVTNPLAWKQVPYTPQQTAGFMEYRFDWTRSQVDYFVDGLRVHSTNLGVPQNPGLVVMNHWSTGASGWEQGPPTVPAVLKVQSFKAYYNSTYDPNTCSVKPKPVCIF
jgi:hypothetical protein